MLEDFFPDCENPEVGGLMAVLAVIGGIDSRLRLGGQVVHDEFGEGTVTRITPKGKITVQFYDMRTCRICPLSQLKPVSLHLYSIFCQYYDNTRSMQTVLCIRDILSCLMTRNRQRNSLMQNKRNQNVNVCAFLSSFL